MILKFIQVVVCISILRFLLLSTIPLCGWTTMPVDGHLGCFQVLAFTNKAAVNICVQVFVWTDVFLSLGCVARSGIAGSRGNSMFNCFPKQSHHATFAPAAYEGPIFHVVPNTCFCPSF